MQVLLEAEEEILMALPTEMLVMPFHLVDGQLCG
jgi:hypothetical protein